MPRLLLIAFALALVFGAACCYSKVCPTTGTVRNTPAIQARPSQPQAPADSDLWQTNRRAMDAYLAAQETLPLIERSDWINVKTDVTPAAVGDGKADDTDAIQAALSMLEGKKPKTRAVFLPAGTYRLTRTLTVTQVQGGAIYGQGRATVLLWDGETAGEPEDGQFGAKIHRGPRMFHSNGFGRNLFFGLTWDGNNKAAVGVDHDSKGYYETRVRHQYCAFRNFVESGIRVGHDQKTASAEMLFYDLLFENCGRGIAFHAFNDYDNAIVRSIFQNCGSGIYCHRGNVYVRDCHFENSREEDLLLPPHSHSIRRCTSRGSHAFLRAAQPGPYSLLATIQDCLVEGWKDPAGAVQLANAGPLTVFDSIFAEPAESASPAIAFLQQSRGPRVLLTANVDYRKVETPLANAQESDRVRDIPRKRPAFLIESYARNRWNHRPVIASKIFDARVDFGATGAGAEDDSAAIQKAIDAAAAHGKNAQAYLPHGTYRIEKTLRLGPGAYSLAGPIGRRTELNWYGPDGEAMIHAHNASGAILRQLFLDGPKEAKATCLRVTADGPGSIRLDGIWAGGNHKPDLKGTHLDHLPAGFVVRSSHLDGECTIDHCGDADVLLDYYFTAYNGAMTVQGPTGRGFLGVHSAAGSHNDPDLTVLDSASIVFGDFYTEQTLRHLVARGAPGQPAGRVTLSNAKLAARQPAIVTVDGYVGQVTIQRANMICRPGVNAEGEPVGMGEKTVRTEDAQPVLPVKGSGDTTLLLMANSHLFAAPRFETQNASAMILASNIWKAGGESSTLRLAPPAPAPLDPALVRAVNAACDHFRDLSRTSLLDGSAPAR